VDMNLSDEGEDIGNVFGRFVTKLKNHTKQIYLFGSIIELYEMAIRLDKNNLSAVSHFAKLYEDFGLVEDAIKILQKALKKQWDDPLAYQLGMNYLYEEDYFSALPLFERQLNSNFEDSHLRYLVALCHCEMGETRVAEDMMMRIIEDNPFEPNVHLRLGRLFNDQGRHIGAKDILEKGLEYQSFDADIREELELTNQYLEKSIVLTN
jgi:tetratricopeptide (TPR) repeat protein